MLVRAQDTVWTVDDLDDLREDDGLQYELVDGLLLVTPGPVPRHQRVVGNLHLLLRAACPGELEVFLAPLDVEFARHTALQPDLLVVRPEVIGEKRIVGAPVLAVEVLSPPTRSKDLVLKRALYEQYGVASYWVVDPVQATVVVWELEAGVYVERVRSSEQVRLEQPFAVEVRPYDLVV